ncbi:unnamed protein product, partial [Dibothriocephalus latus]
MRVSEEPVPRNLTATVVGSTSVRVAWKPPKDIEQIGSKYLIVVRNATCMVKVMVMKTEYILTNMNPSSTYIVTIHATDQLEMPFRAAASISVKMTITVVNVVGDLTASQVNDTTIRVSWTKPSPADNYRDEYHITVYGEGYKKTYTTKETWIIAGGLDTSSVFNITVQGVWSNGTVVPNVATTHLRKPSLGDLLVPRDFTGALLNCTTVRLSWKAPITSQPWGDQYLLVVYNNTYNKSYKLEQTEKIITDLQPSSIYNFTLQAVDKNGKPFRPLAFMSAQTSYCDVPMPMQVTAMILNSNTIRVKWMAPTTSQPWGNRYLLTINNNTYTKSYKVLTTEATISNLQPSSVYNFTLQTLDTSDKPFPAKVFGSVQMPASAVPVPEKVTASIMDGKNLRVRWQPPTNSSKCGDKYQVIVRNKTYQDKKMVTKPEYIISNLNPSSFYNVTVQATDKAGNPFPASASITVKLSANDVPVPKPRDFTASIVNSTTIHVSWQKPLPADKFKDEYHITIYGEGYKKTLTTKDTVITISGLDTSSIYNITVQGFLANGKIVPDVAHTTLQKPSSGLPVPRDFTAIVRTSTSVRMTWTRPTPLTNFLNQYYVTVYGDSYVKRFMFRSTKEVIYGVQPCTITKITIQAVWTNGTVVPAVATTTVQNLPADKLVPTDLGAEPMTSSSVRLAWKPPCQTTNLSNQYLVTVYDGTHNKTYKVDKRQLNITDLEPLTIYNFTVQAIGKDGVPVSSAAFDSTRTLPHG